MKSFEFTVMGEPKGQPRPKAFARKIGNTWRARVYDPGTAEAWKSAIAVAAKEAGLAGAMIQGPIALWVACYFQRPKSHFGTGSKASTLKGIAPIWHTARPDGDNCIKAVKDALKQVGAYRDDSQVCDASICKHYADDAPFSRITITEATE